MDLLTPNDFDQELQSHAGNMAKLRVDMQLALDRGDAIYLLKLVNSNQETLLLQSRLSTLAGRLMLTETTSGYESHQVAKDRLSAAKTKRKRRSMSCLSVRNFVKPLWEAVSCMSGPFTLDQLREHVKQNYALRADDLATMKEGQPRWLGNTRTAFKEFVYSNRNDYNAGRTSEVIIYLDNHADNGYEGLYTLNGAGKQYLERFIASQTEAAI